MTAAIANPTPPIAPASNPEPTAPLRVLGLPAFSPRANPYNRLLCEGLVAGGATVDEFSWRTAFGAPWDIAHVHWPEYMLGSRRYPWLSRPRRAANMAVLRMLKRRGLKVCWTIHNLKPHGMPADTVWRPYAEFLELVDGCIYLSNDSRRLFTERYPVAKDVPGFVIPHGVYDGVYPNTVSSDEARRRLGIPEEAVVAAAVGSVHRYKNLVALVREHVRLDRRDLWLVIAGKPADAALEEELKRAAGGRDDVVLHLRFIADEQLQDYFTAADFCVSPYEDILNSGVVLLALSFGRPVVCPAIGSLVELQSVVGDEWVYAYDGSFDAGVLDAATEWSRRPREAKPSMSSMQWGHIGQQTLAAFRAIVDGHGSELAPSLHDQHPAGSSL